MAGSAEHFANVSTKPDHLASSSPHAEIESLAPFQINRLPLQPRIFHLLLEIASRALSMRATPNQHHTRTHTRARAGGGREEDRDTYGKNVVIVEMNGDGQFGSYETDEFYPLFPIHCLSSQFGREERGIR
jgi:hypothetical protein